MTTVTVSGGFRNAGTWPHNPDAMKHKVVRSRTSQSQTNTNDLSASDILTTLTNVIQSTNITMNNSTDSPGSSDSIQNNTNSAQNSSRRIRTFDDPDSDQSDSNESNNVSPSHNIQLTENNSIDSDEDENFGFTKNTNNTKSTRTSSTTNTLISPQSAAKSIITTYSKDITIPSSSQSTKTSSRIRAQRKYGEIITDGTLLDELKQKANAKKFKKK